MRVLIALLLLAFAPLAVAQSTFVGQIDAEFEIREGTTTASIITPMDITIVTDYSSISAELTWDFDETIAGGPGENFETRLVSQGRYFTNDPLNLSFPNASGVTSTSDTFFDWENEFSVIERIVTFEDSSDSELLSGQSLFQSLEFGVGNYPQAVGFSGYSGHRQLGSLMTSTGEEISMRFDFYNGQFGARSSFSTSLAELLPGDFNSNGLVDAGDYSVWRDTPGFLAPLLTDYGVWRDNFGNSHGAHSVGELTTVPEPPALAILMFASALLPGLASRRQIVLGRSK